MSDQPDSPRPWYVEIESTPEFRVAYLMDANGDCVAGDITEENAERIAAWSAAQPQEGAGEAAILELLEQSNADIAAGRLHDHEDVKRELLAEPPADAGGEAEQLLAALWSHLREYPNAGEHISFRADLGRAKELMARELAAAKGEASELHFEIADIQHSTQAEHDQLRSELAAAKAEVAWTQKTKLSLWTKLCDFAQAMGCGNQRGCYNSDQLFAEMGAELTRLRQENERLADYRAAYLASASDAREALLRQLKPLPAGAIVFVPTGEVRPAQPGEYWGGEGGEIFCGQTVSAWPILRRLDPSEYGA